MSDSNNGNSNTNNNNDNGNDNTSSTASPTDQSSASSTLNVQISSSATPTDTPASSTAVNDQSGSNGSSSEPASPLVPQPLKAALSEGLPEVQVSPQGPDFIDSGVCHCVLRDLTDSAQQGWRCVGNQTTDLYNGMSGKWFWPQNNNSQTDFSTLMYYDNSNPPNNSTSLITDPNNASRLVGESTVQPSPLSVYDEACTGVNNTYLTARYYHVRNETGQSVEPLDGNPCFELNAIPLPIQNGSSWQTEGCNLGFWCPNNSPNALPEYCTPSPTCFAERLAGGLCGTAQGIFEPVLCNASSYCPAGGQQYLTCPEGHFCPPGTFEPFPCGLGGHCPEGSRVNLQIIPFGLLAILDVILIVVTFLAQLGSHYASSRHGHTLMTRKKSYRMPKESDITHLKQRVAGYQELEDTEMTNFEPQTLRRMPTGFRAAADRSSLKPVLLAQSNEINHDTPELQAFVKSLSKAIEGTTFGLSFAFNDLRFQPKAASRPILEHVTGCINAGTLVGIMGGSGAGKSTFVNVLMGKQPQTGGLVKVNGAPAKVATYKKMIGYVPQDDVVLPELTVRENILHSARIRLPSNWSDEDIQEHVDVLIDCLELQHVKYSLVGSTAAPVISGGQRKRVSIGMELAAAPMALFLDEPTSGLDANAASSVMKTLKALSRLGITVVTIIHQPRQEIWELLDDVILLGNGRVIYSGLEHQVQGYFERDGFVFPNHTNPADILIDVITGQGRMYKPKGEISKEYLIERWHNITQGEMTSSSRASTMQENMALKRSIKKRGAPMYRQTWFCLTRALLQQYRARSSFWYEMGVATLAGFLIGLAQNGKKGVNFSGIYNGDYAPLSSALNYQSVPMMSLLVAISIGLVASAPGVKVFGEERLQYYRETAAGQNPLAYYMAKLISTIPRMALGCLHFTTLFMLLATPLIPWGTALLSNLLYYYCIYGLASCVSMITRREDGPLLATMASLIVGVLSGMAPTLAKVSTWHMIWLWRASPGVWIGEIYFSENILPLKYLYMVSDASKRVGFQLDRLALDCGILLVIGTLYRIIAFGGLVLVNRHKQR